MRWCSWHYLVHKWPTVSTINENGEYEIKQSKYCKSGDLVWILEEEKLIEARII